MYSDGWSFDATPPGQQPTKHTPAAWAGGRRQIIEARTADAGMTQNCDRNPTATGFGRWAILRKSSVSSVVPMASMVNARAAVIFGPSNLRREGPRGVAPTTAAPFSAVEKNFYRRNRKI